MFTNWRGGARFEDMNKRLPIIVVATALLAAAFAPARAQRTIHVSYDDGRAAEDVAAYRLTDEGDVRFLRAGDVARLLRATQFWNASSRKVVLGVGRSRFVLTVDTRVVVVDGEPVLLRAPVRYDGGFVMVPMEFVLEVASQYTPRVFVFDDQAGTLRVQGAGYNVRGITFGAAGNRTTATIDLDEPLLYHMDANTPGLVRLKLYGGRVDPRKVGLRQRRGLIEGVRAEQTERDAYLYFDVVRSVRRVRIDRNESPHQVVLVLEKGDLPEIPEPEFEGQEVVEIVDESTAERRALRIAKVCIDPGHGGQDHGKASPDGLLEKDVTLALAREMKRRLEDELGLEVVMTRDDDRLLSLTQRTEIANEAGANVFISVHCNSWFSAQTGGFETYFLAPARSESERALQRYENAAGGSSGETPVGDLEFIVWDLVQNEFINESSTLAEYVQRALGERLDIRNRGVKQANFVVLQGARMPAVLIETAFLSNPTEERMLADPDFHRDVADCMVEALRRMKERYEQR